jgi:hypothetical protein
MVHYQCQLLNIKFFYLNLKLESIITNHVLYKYQIAEMIPCQSS